MQEVKINKCVLNERKELQINLLIKEGDYNEVEAELLRQAKLNGDLLDLKFTGLTSGDTEKQNKKNLQTLDVLMTSYCSKADIKKEDEVKRLYNKYKVNSRRDMNPSDVESEIEIYKNGMLEFI